eukprot:9492267-Pyramimonas_sp.AAC.1
MPWRCLMLVHRSVLQTTLKELCSEAGPRGWWMGGMSKKSAGLPCSSFCVDCFALAPMAPLPWSTVLFLGMLGGLRIPIFAPPSRVVLE